MYGWPDECLQAALWANKNVLDTAWIIAALASNAVDAHSSHKHGSCEPSHLALAILIAKGFLHQLLIVAFLLASFKP